MNTGHYRFRFYLNARHIVSFHNIDSKIHPHTWELVLHVKKGAEVFKQFSEMEREIQHFLAAYEGNCLNQITPFDTLMPIMENIGDTFAAILTDRLAVSGWQLLQFEISENPARSYIVTSLSKQGDGSAVLQQGEKQGDGSAVLQQVQQGDRSAVLQQDEKQGDGSAVSQQGEKQGDGSAVLQQVQQGDGSALLVIDELTKAAKVENRPSSTLENCPLSAPASMVHLKRPRGKKRGHSEKIRIPNLWYLLLGTLAALVVGAAVFWWITRDGVYPWGSDSWYHLFKGHLLYESIREGNFFPLYSEAWYNGIQPLRYWAPLPHYVLAVIELMTGGNTALSYNLSIVLVFTVGAAGWLLWGSRTGRRKLAFLLALLWFFLPDNLRVLFSEGNLSRVAVSTIFPYLLLSVTMYFEKRSIRSLAAIGCYMLVITLCHAMIAAMVAVTITLFALFYGLAEKKKWLGLQIIAAAACGIAAAGIWLVPALSGGLLGMDGEAVKVLAEGLTYPALDSLNPILRLTDPNVFYFGASIFAAVIFGLLFGGRKVRALFAVTGIIFLGTTKALLPLIVKLPLSQAFWMMRFTPLAMGVFFAGLLLWKGLRKELLAAILVLVIMDGAVSFSVLGHDSKMPAATLEVLQPAGAQTSNRLALLDGSRFGSFPSFYLSFNESGKSTRQVFGSGWQGAATAENIMWLNTALEKHWYGYLFDRCLELGADTITITKSAAGESVVTRLKSDAEKAGYRLNMESTAAWTFKYSVDGSFGTTVEYEGLGIGKYVLNLSLVFPQIEKGKSDYLDDYSFEELSRYKVIYLSGFRFRDKTTAEKLVTELSEKGIKVVVDLNNADEELFSSRAYFMDVLAEEVVFKGTFPEMDTMEGRLAFMQEIPQEFEQWRAIYLENLDSVQAGTYYRNQQLDVIGTKLNNNMVFVGLNLPYYAMLTGDSTAVKLLEGAIGLEAGKLPERMPVQLEMAADGNTITLHADREGVMAGIAALDTFKAVQGSYTVRNNLVYMKDRDLVLEVGYPVPGKGLAVSVFGVAALIALILVVRRRNVKLAIYYEAGNKVEAADGIAGSINHAVMITDEKKVGADA